MARDFAFGAHAWDPGVKPEAREGLFERMLTAYTSWSMARDDGFWQELHASADQPVLPTYTPYDLGEYS